VAISTRLIAVLRMIGRLCYDLPLLVRLLRAWKNGRYPGLSLRTLASIAAALLYVLSPVDLVPDFIPGVGLLDDMAVLGLVFQTLSQDLAAFRVWEQSRR